MKSSARAISFVFFLFSMALLLAGPVSADDQKNKSKSEKSTSDETEDKDKDKDKLVSTQHTTTIDGKEIKYTATAGKLVMKDDEGKAKAHIFFVAYTKDGVNDLVKRPITFAFNGGPGSSSVWLHLGILGPKRIEIPDDGSVLDPPYTLTSNPHSLLDITDLVFIDPVSTGYSRPVKGEDKGQFHGYSQDIRSVGQFIHEYLSKNNRWRSEKFLLGESYGGLRSAGLANHLFNRYRVPLSGIVMISPALNFLTLDFEPGNDLPYFLFVPTYAATAWYHGALPGDLQALPLDEVVRQATEFATSEYALALLKGHSLRSAEHKAVSEKLSRYTGLSREFVESANLRISMQRFAKELLRGRSQTIGRYDSRYTGIDSDNAGETPDFDPSGAKLFGPFAVTINDYLRNDLKFDDERVYEILTGNVQPWPFAGAGMGDSPDGSVPLRQVMAANPRMKVFFACGYYDLATPVETVEYSVDHMRLPVELQKNLAFGYYEGGHMMYVHEPSAIKLRSDLAAFYKSALSPSEDK